MKVLILHCDSQKRGSTFVIISLEDLDFKRFTYLETGINALCKQAIYGRPME